MSHRWDGVLLDYRQGQLAAIDQVVPVVHRRPHPVKPRTRDRRLPAGRAHQTRRMVGGIVEWKPVTAGRPPIRWGICMSHRWEGLQPLAILANQGTGCVFQVKDDQRVFFRQARGARGDRDLVGVGKDVVQAVGRKRDPR